MAFEPQNPLEEALVRAAQDPSARPAFYRHLMSARLLALGDVGRVSASGAIAHLGPDDTIRIAAVRHNGRDYHPVFTSPARLNTFATRPDRCFTATGAELFSRTRGAHYLLNPKSELGRQLMASEIAFWLDPSARARRNLRRNPPRVIVRMPEIHPKKLADALCVLFRNRSDVVSAHLVEAMFSDRPEPPHPLIAIETTGSWNKIYIEVSMLAATLLPELIIDVIRLDRTRPVDALMSAILKTPPLYARQQTE